MATRGPKPKPTAIKIAGGTRKDRINTAEPPRLDGDPEIPAYLDDEARAEWTRMTDHLRKLGILSAAHAPTLGLYCQQHSRLVRAEERIAEKGLTEETARGALVMSPYVRIAREASAFCLKVLAEFGLSPSASSRITTSASAAPADQLEEFLKRG
jgi:P27 family predicted phage terminase small subunit